MDSNYVDKLKCLNKAVTIVRSGEVHDDYSWALKLTDDERIKIADRFLRDLWCTANGQPFPKMNRTAVCLVRR